MSLLDEIPGYREAVEAECRFREGAFLRIPEFVCGIQVEPLTLRHIALFSQFSIEPEPSAEAMEVFLWTVAANKNRRFARLRHTARCAWLCMRHTPGLVAAAAQAWLAESFADSPGSTSEQVAANPTSWLSQHVDLFAAEYGWSIEQALDLPVKVALQLERDIRRRNSTHKPMFFNPSDRVRTEWLEEKQHARN